MTLRFKSGLKARAKELAASRKAYLTQMKAGLRKVESQARVLALEGINIGVYDTEPGKKYKRTENLRDSLLVTSALFGSELQVNVVNTSEHASQVEFGQDEDYQDESDLEPKALALGTNATPLYFSRTGRNYKVPNPAHLRAAAYALLLLGDLHEQSMKKVFFAPPAATGGG